MRSVFAAYGIYRRETVRWPGWRTTVEGRDEKTWLRADVGGIVEMHHGRGDLAYEDDPICDVTNPFEEEPTVVRSPFAGIVVWVLENPVVYPGDPLCHFVSVGRTVQRIVERHERAHGGNETQRLARP